MSLSNNDSETKTDSYNPAIDGLRAIAVLSVIINHFYQKLLPSGYLGVDIFFVISGFVITTSLIKRNEVDAKEFFIGFYKRRIKRLMPALLLYFCTTSLLISFFNSFPFQHITTGLFSIPGFSNIYYAFDPLPIYCNDSNKCTRIINGVVAFKDTNHLTSEGAQMMLNDFFLFLVRNKLL